MIAYYILYGILLKQNFTKTDVSIPIPIIFTTKESCAKTLALNDKELTEKGYKTRLKCELVQVEVKK